MDSTKDIAQIRNLIESWVAYRDAFLWEKFRKVWHPEGIMIATWSQSTFEEFITNTEEGKKNSNLWYMHILGGSGIEVNGDRAISMTKMIITQRITISGIPCDMNCFARHFDFWQKYEKDGESVWGLRRRETVCDKDNLSPVNPMDAGKIKLDENRLAMYPEEYRYLAYCIVENGYPCSTDNVPIYSGNPALYDLYERGEKWLAGTLQKPEGDN